MKKNIGTKDRVIRAVLGLVLIGGSFFVESTVGRITSIAFGLFCFYEAFSSWCLLYQLLGRNTCPLE